MDTINPYPPFHITYNGIDGYRFRIHAKMYLVEVIFITREIVGFCKHYQSEGFYIPEVLLNRVLQSINLVHYLDVVLRTRFSS